MSTILFVFSRPPHGSINAQEGLDALLMGSAFTTCSVLFVGDGLMQLVAGQSTDDLGTKNFSLSFGALKDYGVTRIACSKPDLLASGLNKDDFLIEVESLNAAAMQAFIRNHDKVLNF
jgi:tRNA 2-thiouridine synthesizing protein C|tara:strand:- start:551 stop:904 length:354 start_codon:yes stop_codon:yes gene_type:complete